ncbi:conserved hypothetical protein [Candidatus Defluviicoccus seviourii]|uniref:Glycosyl transferase family 1 domain-containing protein n=1 Tax=Candidatus Defluviicoccus seviourii TaxID=2565273 RepID=A0A564WCX1_9PROT|nr:conserved hypothetical protein [Candidatus Defluviicoccus seviourii]
MRRIHVIAARFLNTSGTLEIGGVETYIQLLATAVSGEFATTVYQPSAAPYETTLPNINVIGMGKLSIHSMVQTIENRYLSHDDLLLFSTEHFSCRHTFNRVIVIQHGVSWDLPTPLLTTRQVALRAEGAYRVYLSYYMYRKLRHFRNVVCVDYNYINWWRTLSTTLHRTRTFYCIPNCAGRGFEMTGPRRDNAIVTLCFARRFVEIRGLRLFLGAISMLLSRFATLRILLCGSGSQELMELCRRICISEPRVQHLMAGYDEMPSVLARSDIVVIPSLGSEGTTFSAVEAMAMGCCVVATNVGGLTNIIIDGYNGFLVNPDVESLVEKLTFLLSNRSVMISVGAQAREIYRHALSFERWRERWMSVISNIYTSS